MPMHELERACRTWKSRAVAGLRALADPTDAGQRSRAAMLLGRLDGSFAAHRSYRRLTRNVHRSGARDMPWHWHKVFEDEEIRVGLLTLEPDGRIPFHDHPGSTGALLVLQGSVEIIQCKVQRSTEANGTAASASRSASLAIVWSGRAGVRQAAFLTPDAGNIHGLWTRTGLLALEVFVDPYPVDRRTWYVSEVPDPNDPGSLLAAPLLPDDGSRNFLETKGSLKIMTTQTMQRKPQNPFDKRSLRGFANGALACAALSAAAILGYVIREGGHLGEHLSAFPNETAYIETCAAEGNAACEATVGIIAQTGFGMLRNPELAFEMTRRAADKGFPRAQLNLGLLYFLGLGVEANEDQGVSWIRKAADQKDPEAQLVLHYLAGIEENVLGC